MRRVLYIPVVHGPNVCLRTLFEACESVASRMIVQRQMATQCIASEQLESVEHLECSLQPLSPSRFTE